MNRDQCAIRQAGDATWCETCGEEWDTNDYEPPACPYIKSQEPKREFSYLIKWVCVGLVILWLAMLL